MADVKNAKDAKFEEVKNGESGKETKQEGKGKRILRKVAREAMFTLAGAAAVGAIWGYKTKSDKASKKDDGSESEEEQSEEKSEEKD